MNDDIKTLGMLLRYAQRHMVGVVGQVQSCLGGDAELARRVLARLERRGLVYVEGVSVRLTLPGFAQAVAAMAPDAASKGASVHRLGRPAKGRRSPRSHAA